MTDKEVHDLLQEFAAPLAPYVTSPDRETGLKPWSRLSGWR